MRAALMASVDVIIMVCAWVEAEKACRVLPAWADEIRDLWQRGYGHDYRMAVACEAPAGDVLCMAYRGYPDLSHNSELLIAREYLTQCRESTDAAQQLARVIRCCARRITEPDEQGCDIASILAVNADERTRLYTTPRLHIDHYATPPLAPFRVPVLLTVEREMRAG